MFQNLLSMLKNEEGATLVEYALIVSLISVACIFVLGTLATAVKTTLTNAAGQMH